MAEPNNRTSCDVPWTGLLAVFAVIVVVVLTAEMLSERRFFAFPLGTFLLGLGVPVALYAVMLAQPSGDEK